MKKILFLLILGAGLTGCSARKQIQANDNVVVLGGKLSKRGVTTFQYGTHLLDAGDKTYALKSSKVNLDGFAERQVVLKGTRVEGYPLENGPDLIEVLEVRAQ